MRLFWKANKKGHKSALLVPAVNCDGSSEL
jgi:hypothetical protein